MSVFPVDLYSSQSCFQVVKSYGQNLELSLKQELERDSLLPQSKKEMPYSTSWGRLLGGVHARSFIFLLPVFLPGVWILMEQIVNEQ